MRARACGSALALCPNGANRREGERLACGGEGRPDPFACKDKFLRAGCILNALPICVSISGLSVFLPPGMFLLGRIACPRKTP